MVIHDPRLGSPSHQLLTRFDIQPSLEGVGFGPTPTLEAYGLNPQTIAPGDLMTEILRILRGVVPDGFVGGSQYFVKPGDTLSHIAKDHGVSLDSLIAANPQIKNPDLIYPGDEIRIPSPNSSNAPPRTQPGLEGPQTNGITRRGSAGESVVQLQERLNTLGYGAGPVDGQFGPITQGALRRFQIANNLNTTGRMDSATTVALNSPSAQRYEPQTGDVPKLETYPPGSPEQVRLFEEAARRVGVPESWASDPGLINILRRESNGRVGVPNYTYGARARNPAQWASVHQELKNGRKTARSSATGLGQLLLSNVDRYYPNGRAGIGNPVEEAAGMLAYIKDRYGHPATAWARYNTAHEGY